MYGKLMQLIVEGSKLFKMHIHQSVVWQLAQNEYKLYNYLLTYTFSLRLSKSLEISFPNLSALLLVFQIILIHQSTSSSSSDS